MSEGEPGQERNKLPSEMSGKELAKKRFLDKVEHNEEDYFFRESQPIYVIGSSDYEIEMGAIYYKSPTKKRSISTELRRRLYSIEIKAPIFNKIRTMIYKNDRIVFRLIRSNKNMEAKELLKKIRITALGKLSRLKDEYIKKNDARTVAAIGVYEKCLFDYLNPRFYSLKGKYNTNKGVIKHVDRKEYNKRWDENVGYN